MWLDINNVNSSQVLNVKTASHMCWFTARERNTAEMQYLTTDQMFIIVERMTWQG